ncbi:MAG: hypothetical protein R3Y60_02180 [bacterium]
MEFATIPIIVILCTIVMSIVKLFTKGNENETEILAAIIPCFGAMFTLVLYFVHTDFMMEFDDPIVAVLIGFVSGQSALETKSTFDYIKSKQEIKDLIIEELQTDETQTLIKDTVETAIEPIVEETTTLIEEKVVEIKEELNNSENDNIE